jgi:predicted HNH restriction endonuclease
MWICKYCKVEQPEEAFEICRVVKGKVYRRLRCQRCKRQKTNERRAALRQWLDDYKKTLKCGQCGFADYRALEFHHPGQREKDFNVADMIRSGLSRKAIVTEIAKCITLCSNCHQIAHYDERKKSWSVKKLRKTTRGPKPTRSTFASR